MKMPSLSIKERNSKTLFLILSKKYTMIEEFKDELKDFKKILNKIKELKLLREQEKYEIKNETKRVLSMLDDEVSNISEKVDLNLINLKLRCKFCEKPYDFKKERELRLSPKEKMNKIEGLKEEVENNEDELLDHSLDGETKISKLLNLKPNY